MQQEDGQGSGITHIGGTNSDGTAWTMSESDAVAGIKTGKLKFYVNIDRMGLSKGVWLGVEQKQGREVLATTGDGADPSTLLNLPDCP